jgi:hypothetical protein
MNIVIITSHCNTFQVTEKQCQFKSHDIFYYLFDLQARGYSRPSPADEGQAS